MAVSNNTKGSPAAPAAAPSLGPPPATAPVVTVDEVVVPASAPTAVSTEPAEVWVATPRPPNPARVPAMPGTPALPSMSLGTGARPLPAKSLSTITTDYPALAPVLASKGHLTNQDLVTAFSKNVDASRAQVNASVYGLNIEAMKASPTSTVDLTAPTPTSALAKSPLLDQAATKLVRGQKNELVKALQQDLLALNQTVIGEADGDYGGNTQKAVAAFAASRGLPGDGRTLTPEIIGEIIKAKEILAQDHAALAQDSDDLTRELSDKNRPLLNQLRDKFEALDDVTDPAKKATAAKDLAEWLTTSMHRAIEQGRISPEVAEQWQEIEGAFDRAAARGSLQAELGKFRGELQAQLMADFNVNARNLAKTIAQVDVDGAKRLLDGMNKVTEAKPNKAFEAFTDSYKEIEQYMRENEPRLPPEATRDWRHLKIEFARAQREGGDNAVLALSRRQRKVVVQTAMNFIADDAKRLNPSAEQLDLSEKLKAQLTMLERAADGAGAFTPEMLRKVVPTMTEARAEALMPHINKAMEEANIVTPQARATFVAQLAHETAGFLYLKELGGPAYFKKMYEPNWPLAEDTGDDFARRNRRAASLGNTQAGDGARFPGRGAIQLTGRSNYTLASASLFPDDPLKLINTPEVAEQLDNAFRTAGWFWTKTRLNEPADAGDFRLVTKRINGGYNGFDDRLKYYTRALDVLGASAPVVT